jgi:hypothetical protein
MIIVIMLRRTATHSRRTTAYHPRRRATPAQLQALAHARAVKAAMHGGAIRRRPSHRRALLY